MGMFSDWITGKTTETNTSQETENEHTEQQDTEQGALDPQAIATLEKKMEEFEAHLESVVKAKDEEITKLKTELRDRIKNSVIPESEMLKNNPIDGQQTMESIVENYFNSPQSLVSKYLGNKLQEAKK